MFKTSAKQNGTWNVRTFNGNSDIVKLPDALRYARSDITALKEITMSG